MFDIFIHGRSNEVEEGFEERGDECPGAVADVVDDDDAFRLFEDFEDVDCIGVVCLFTRLEVFELFDEELKDFLMSNNIGRDCTLSCTALNGASGAHILNASTTQTAT
jgi:hypothetical protein